MTDTTAMRAAILEFLDRDHVSFAELHHNIPNFAGDTAMGLDTTGGPIDLGNLTVILWDGMSKEAHNTISDLLANGVIKLQPSTPLTYAIDGATFNIPTLTDRDTKRFHKRPKTAWLPVVLRPGPNFGAAA